MNLWIEVSRDIYELPVAVAGSAAELARIRGVSEHTIASMASKYANGRIPTSIYRKVVIDGEEETL